jgi:hypothetical protein
MLAVAAAKITASKNKGFVGIIQELRLGSWDGAKNHRSPAPYGGSDEASRFRRLVPQVLGPGAPSRGKHRDPRDH